MLIKIMFIVISYSVSLTSIFAIANLKPQTDDILLAVTIWILEV